MMSLSHENFDWLTGEPTAFFHLFLVEKIIKKKLKRKKAEILLIDQNLPDHISNLSSRILRPNSSGINIFQYICTYNTYT
jgi:hypothetical protein